MKNTVPGEKICDYCHTNPGAKPGNKILWAGFYDKDMDKLVCWNCKRTHYILKSKSKHKGLYTEFPVYNN